MHTKIKVLGFCVGMAFLSLFLLPQNSLAVVASSADFQLDFGSTKSLSEVSSSADFQVQGGVVDIATRGASSDFQIVPVHQIIFCGDGVLETGESCDGAALGGATCTSQGFTSGTLGCTSSCTFDTSSCQSGSGRGSGTDITTQTEDTVYVVSPSEEEMPDEVVEEVPSPVEIPVVAKRIPLAEEPLHGAPSRPEQLFDITFDLDDNVIKGAGQLSGVVTLESFGTASTPSIELTFIILDEAGNEIYREQSSTTVMTAELFRWNYVQLPELAAGKYTAVLQTRYGDDVFDEFRIPFEIRLPWQLPATPCLILIGGLVGIIFWLSFLLLRRHKKMHSLLHSSQVILRLWLSKFGVKHSNNNKK